ncbi:28S ribosomal protein S18b, mitochondrial [Trichogramma pretiosum]|uniref:28S ribosomal protein S18b, mitochondrial n=1 Tax=Trichogramma pretiosum TaxID=7493 RepID=UPI0006C99E90|nr:28S ribosomal protein S18b, mitochondrial [Trichogramma pretiosum]
MSIVRLGIQSLINSNLNGIRRVIAVRNISKTTSSYQESQPKGEEDLVIEDQENPEDTEPKVHPSSDRSRVIPVETSIQYLHSDAYKITYGDDPIWKKYRRNHKGPRAPRKTRKTCIRYDALATSNPCPICRDEYLVLDHKNVKLLQQFISPYNGELLSYSKTGLCQKQHQNLLIALYRAKDYGTITFDLPYMKYDYKEWNPSSESPEDIDLYRERMQELVKEILAKNAIERQKVIEAEKEAQNQENKLN